jgi:NodT family efflux transporter outer membrane factor (OMF) lipoprotein
MSRARPILAASLALVASWCAGCKVGPDYHAPAQDVPQAFGELGVGASGQYSHISPDQPPWIEWWTKFGDAELDSLVSRAVKANHELRIAAARVLQARAEERMADSRLYPSLSIGAGAFVTHGSEAGFGVPFGIPGVSSNLFQLGFDASYEVDLFGGVRRSIEAAGAFAEASEDNRRGVQVSLLGEVARSYISLRALQRRLAVAHDNLDTQRRTAEIIEQRFKNGLAANFDVVRARAQVVATESSIPPLEAGIRQRIHELSTLLGEHPLSLSDELASSAPVPPVPPDVPIGLPSELLRRRPDIMKAERTLAAATALEGVATAELFPHLILGGSAGVQSRHFDSLFREHNPSSGYYSAGPSAQWTIFDGGYRRANIDRSKAVVAEAAAAYEATVLGSLRDVEDALSAYSSDQTRRTTLSALVDQQQEALRIARKQLSEGLVPVLDVLDVQRSLYAAQDALAQGDQAVSSDLVAIYKALGGGWESLSGEVPAPTERQSAGSATGSWTRERS